MKQEVIQLWQHPVKGLRPISLERSEFVLGRGMLGDRIFSFLFLDHSVPAELQTQDPFTLPHTSKVHLLTQHDWPVLAQVSGTYDPKTFSLILENHGTGVKKSAGDVRNMSDRNRLSDFVFSLLQNATPYTKSHHKLLSPLRLLGSADQSMRYTDSGNAPVTLVLQESVDDLAQKLGLELDMRRFRQNIILKGAPAWSELKWKEKNIRIGSCEFKITKPVGRCANIDVNPETGERDLELLAKLKPTLGHAMLGMKCEVVTAGMVNTGDTWQLS